MSAKMSTGLCNMLLGGVTGHGDLKTIIDSNWKLMIYGGTVPATADAALGGATLLCTVANGGSAITMDTAASGGVLSKNTGETWSGVNAATGTATFFRFQKTADDGLASTVEPRIQGTVGVGGADLNLASVAFTSGATSTVNVFTVGEIPS